MKIAVFGSTGPTGKELIIQALKAGYEVKAFARSSDKLKEFQNEKLEVIKGNLADRELIERTIVGVDAVISVLGPKGKVKDTALSDGMKNIIDGMKKVGVKRLIALSTGSVKDGQDRFDLIYSFLVGIIKIGVRSAYDEIIRNGEIIRSSGLEWTLVRVGFLNDKPSKPIKVGYYGRGVVKVLISRASIAKFMLDQVKSTEYIRKSPGISN